MGGLKQQLLVTTQKQRVIQGWFPGKSGVDLNGSQGHIFSCEADSASGGFYQICLRATPRGALILRKGPQVSNALIPKYKLDEQIEEPKSPDLVHIRGGEFIFLVASSSRSMSDKVLRFLFVGCIPRVYLFWPAQTANLKLRLFTSLCFMVRSI